jgi:hypothetical protein
MSKDFLTVPHQYLRIGSCASVRGVSKYKTSLRVIDGPLQMPSRLRGERIILIIIFMVRQGPGRFSDSHVRFCEHAYVGGGGRIDREDDCADSGGHAVDKSRKSGREGLNGALRIRNSSTGGKTLRTSIVWNCKAAHDC